MRYSPLLVCVVGWMQSEMWRVYQPSHIPVKTFFDWTVSFKETVEWVSVEQWTLNIYLNYSPKSTVII